MGLLDDIKAATRSNAQRLGGLIDIDSTGNGLLSDLDFAKRNALSRLKYNVGSSLDSAGRYFSGDPTHWLRQPATAESNAAIDEVLMNYGPGEGLGLAGTFIGKQGAANLGKGELMGQVEKSFQKGEMPYSAWREHQITQFPHDKKMRMEIDDSNSLVFPEEARYDSNVPSGTYMTTLGKMLEHPKLYKAYPDLEDLPIIMGGAEFRGTDGAEGTASLRGRYTPGELESIGLNPSLESDPQQLRSTLLHEVQHAIQEREGFGKGSMPNRAKPEAMESLMEIRSQNGDASALYDLARERLGRLHDMQRARKYEDMANRSGIRPSAINRLSDWYEHSDGVRSALGPMPKRAGEARDQWMRSAFGMLRDKQVAEMAQKYRPALMEQLTAMDPKDLKRAIGQSERQLNKYSGGAADAYKAEALQKRLREMTDFEVYQRAGGEGEARLTQDRIDMTPEDRMWANPLIVDKWGGVPREDLFNIRRKSLLED